MIFLGFAEPAVGGLSVVIRRFRPRRPRCTWTIWTRFVEECFQLDLATVGHPSTGPPR